MASERGALVISLDFELHWGVHDLYPIAQYRDNLLGVRAAVPAMLRLFEEFEVHVTWATIGMLFFESKRELLAGLPSRRPVYDRARRSPYRLLPDVGDGERDDPLHFAPSLIRLIAGTRHQEIGTHTFSHYYCLEPGQSPEDFRADLRAAMEVTRAKLGYPPRSLVFPRNQVSEAHLAVCRELGLLTYRGNLDLWAYRARRFDGESRVRRAVRLADGYLPLTGTNGWPAAQCAASAPVDVPASRYLRPYHPALRRFEGVRLQRITTALRHAARRGHVFHLWWHPHDFGVFLEENLAVLRRILRCFAELRDGWGMESLTMAEVGERVLRGPHTHGEGEPVAAGGRAPVHDAVAVGASAGIS